LERWYLLKVRQGFEPVVAQALRQKRIKVFIPLPRCDKSQRSRFGSPGYLLCRFDLRRRQVVLAVPGARCIVGIPEPVALDDHEIVALHKIGRGRL
jgi:transcription antitermination factor NusG